MGVWPIWELTTVGILGLGIPLAGVARWREWDWVGASIAGLTGCFAIAAAATGQSVYMWLSCGGFAGLFLASTFWQPLARIGCASTRLAARSWSACEVRISRSRALQALPFLLSGPLLTFVWAERVDQDCSVPELTLDDFVGLPLELIKYPHEARTDRGHAVLLFTPKFDPESDQALLNAEKQEGLKYPFGMLRLSSPDPTYDCHGWVFAAGRFHVKSPAVDTILTDNGYQKVKKPQGGDLIVYRNQSDQVVHTGIVRSVTETAVTIESKWGSLGRYLHDPANQPYDKNWAYYRSARDGHLLNLDGTLPMTQMNSAE